MTGNTPVRTFRLDDARWDALAEYAGGHSLSASDALRDLIDRALIIPDQGAERPYWYWRNRTAEQTATLARLDTIHVPNEEQTRFCQECGHTWPCRTARVLQGIEPWDA